MTNEQTANDTDECEKCRHTRATHKDGKGACTDDVATKWNPHGEPEEFESCECPFFHNHPPKKT